MERVNTSERLKQLMKERNLKQVDILNLTLPICAKYNIKMNKSDISQYVSGKVEPGQVKLSVLGIALNVNEAWLMGFDVPCKRGEFEKQQSSEIINILELIEKQYGNDIKEAFAIYTQLDIIDQAKINERMKILLEDEKYSVKKESSNVKAM